MAKRIRLFRKSSLSQSLPQHGLLYFDHLRAELRSRPLGDLDGETRGVLDELLNKRQEASLTWNDLYTMDLILSALLPPERLAREVWSLRSRYRDVAGLREYEAYLASRPPDPEGQVEEKALRADIQFLLGEIYLRYAITPLDQGVRDRISKRVTVIILGGLGVIVLAIVLSIWLGGGKLPPAPMGTVLFCGIMGGLLSMQQRYQTVAREGDPIDNISELMQEWPRLFFPAISGALFALLLYMMIIGGLLQGDLFPALTGQSSGTDGFAIWDFIKSGRPVAAGDYAKLIIWSFLAGFAERFVPDTLTSFITKRESETTKRT